MEFPSQEYWGGCHLLLLNQGWKLNLLHLQADSLLPHHLGCPTYACLYIKKKRKENNDSECQKILLTICSFHTVHQVLKARILKWFAIAFSSGPRFVRSLQED